MLLGGFVFCYTALFAVIAFFVVCSPLSGCVITYRQKYIWISKEIEGWDPQRWKSCFPFTAKAKINFKIQFLIQNRRQIFILVSTIKKSLFILDCSTNFVHQMFFLCDCNCVQWYKKALLTISWTVLKRVLQCLCFIQSLLEGWTMSSFCKM